MVFPVTFDPQSGLEIVRRISIFEILSVIGIVVAVASLIISMAASVRQERLGSAEFCLKMWDRFRADDIQSAFLDVEWSRFQYPMLTATGFKDDQTERNVDRLLSLLDDICLLVKRGVLSYDDIASWDYIFTRVFNNKSIVRYLEFLDKFYEANGVKDGPHMLARNWKMPSKKRFWVRQFHPI